MPTINWQFGYYKAWNSISNIVASFLFSDTHTLAAIYNQSLLLTCSSLGASPRLCWFSCSSISRKTSGLALCVTVSSMVLWLFLLERKDSMLSLLFCFSQCMDDVCHVHYIFNYKPDVVLACCVETNSFLIQPTVCHSFCQNITVVDELDLFKDVINTFTAWLFFRGSSTSCYKEVDDKIWFFNDCQRDSIFKFALQAR